MKIIVTGGSGMVGRCIQDLTDLYNKHEFTFISSAICDLTNREKTIQYFNKHDYDYIIHLAADVGGLYKNMENNISMFSNNIKINENVLEACHLNNIKRGIFVLSSCIYPANPSTFPMTENMIHESPPHPSNEGYAYAKRMLEVQTRKYNETYNYDYICVIPVNLYGPYDNFSLTDGHFIPAILRRFDKIKTIGNVYTSKYTAYGTGEPLRQFLFAPDFAFLITKILFEYNSNTPIICCNDDEYTIKEVVHTICDMMQIEHRKIEWDTTKSDGCMRKTVSNYKLKSLFPNYKFTSLLEGLEHTYYWFISNESNIRR